MPERPTRNTSPLYLELPAGLRERLDAFVARNRRKLKGEVCNAIEQYLDREEAKETPRAEAPQPPARAPKRVQKRKGGD